jgi:hypothetical protein
MSYLHGNCADTTSPPGLFNGWLVGPLADWSAKPPELAAAKAKLAAAADAAVGADRSWLGSLPRYGSILPALY